jgi:hypothetical protein
MATGQSLPKKAYTDNDAPVRTTVALDFDGRLPKPTDDLDVAKADLGRAGYAIVSDVLEPSQVREFRRILVGEIAREEALDESRVRRLFTDPDDKNRRLDRLPNRHRWFRDILEHPIALEMTRQILGPTLLNESYLVHSYGANLTRPGRGQQFIHLDRAMAFKDQTKPLQSRFIWCLDELFWRKTAQPESCLEAIFGTTGSTCRARLSTKRFPPRLRPGR